MAAARFVHLRLHSEYSVSDGIVRVKDAVARAAADGMPALALTDAANLFGMVKFYREARLRGVQPVIGADCWIAPAGHDRPQAPHRLLLLCASRAGYRRLCELLSRAWLTNQHRGHPLIDPVWFEDGTDGLIALSGAAEGEVGAQLLAGAQAAAGRAAARLAALFPGRFYLELQRAGFAQEEALIAASVALAARLGLPAVATHPVQFLDQTDFRAHEARVCIASGQSLADRRRPRRFTEAQYFRSQAEMAAAFADLPQALDNTLAIARRCSFELDLGRTRLPDFPTPEGVDLETHLRAEAARGLERRIAALHPDAAVREAARPRYGERLEFELRTIVQMGFAGYFLIVADFINWAKSHRDQRFPLGIPVGPGRGSGAGSLVAWSLGITELDPLRYELLFERFLNPERVSMPDFDIDFCQDGRDLVIDYVRRRYGRDSVSQIATFGTMAARAVVRDVGRVLELGYGFCDEIARLIPVRPGQTVTLADARREEPRLAEREAQEDEVRELLALGGKLEGLPRNVGMHAGGVLIAPGRLTDFCPLYAAEGTDHPVSQLDMKDVEAIGLVKFDFLGLTTLTILDWTLRFVRRLDPDSTLDLATLPLDDPETYRVFATANATAVFQFESRGMRDLLKRALPDRFEDLIALVSLYRPGPMDLIPEFIARKHGQARVEYADPRLEPILGPTYGIMVYQEQVMQIAQVIGGYTLGGADLLRRAMGKKSKEEMDRQRDIFIAGAGRNGMPHGRAAQLFELMEKFAGYGFNKSHAAAYALVACQTAYMKAHHPAAFMAANLSASLDDSDRLRTLVEDTIANGLSVLPPEVNASEFRFVPVDARSIRYGLGGIRGTGEGAITALVEARRAGPFRDLFDFCRRVDKRQVNRRVVEALVRAGAFDALEPNRAALLASVPKAMEAAEQAERSASQTSLFGEAEAPTAAGLLAAVRPWDAKQRLAEEKAAFGFYFSAHPFSVHGAELAHFPRVPLSRLEPADRAVWLAGIVVQVRIAQTRRGRLLIAAIDDGSAQAEFTLPEKLIERHRDKLREDALVVVCGRVQHDEFSGGVRIAPEADGVYDLAGFRRRFRARLRLSMNGQADAARLAELLGPYRDPEACPVLVCYACAAGAAELPLGEAWRVRPEEPLIAALGDWLAPENVCIDYAELSAA